VGIFGLTAGVTAANAARITEIIAEGYKSESTASDIMSSLKDEGLSYRRQDMLADIREYGAIANIPEGRPSAISRALDFYNNVVEPYRKDNGLSSKQAWSDVRTYISKNYESEYQEIELEADLSDYLGDAYNY